MITNLTGTTWVINSTVTLPSADVSYSVVFNDSEYKRFYLVPSGGRLVYMRNNMVQTLVTVYESGEWVDESYRTVTFESGADVTNTDLITWLYANAVLQTYVAKVELDGTALIDLTSDTAEVSDVASGKYFHLATGERVQGTLVVGGITVNDVYYLDGYNLIVLELTDSPGDNVEPSASSVAIVITDSNNKIRQLSFYVDAQNGPCYRAYDEANDAFLVCPLDSESGEEYWGFDTTNAFVVSSIDSRTTDGELYFTETQ